MAEEKIETAEIVSTETKEGKYFVAVKAVAGLRIASEFETLKNERYEAKNKYCNIDKTDANIKNVRDAKNRLVKLRTAVRGSKDCIEDQDKFKVKAVIDEINGELKSRIDTLINITQPLEKELTEVVEKFDNKIKEEEKRKAKELEDAKNELFEVKQNSLRIINSFKSSAEAKLSIYISDKTKELLPEQSEIIAKEIGIAYDERYQFLKDKEEIEKAKAEMAEKQKKLDAEKAEIEKQKAEAIRQSILSEQKAKKFLKDLHKVDDKIIPAIYGDTKIIDDLPEVVNTVTSAELDDLQELSDDDIIEDPETLNELDELEKLIQDQPFNPTLKEIYEHLYSAYPVLHHDKYFMMLKEKI